MNAMNPIQLPGKSFDLNTFTFNGHKLRTLTGGDGKPWFAAGDVLRAVGIKVDPVRGARIYLPKDLPADSTRLEYLPPETFCSGKASGVRRVLLISEDALYLFVMRAQRKSPAVREFQDWITKEVLPRIRRDGAYIMGEEKVATGEDCARRPQEVHTAPPCATR